MPRESKKCGTCCRKTPPRVNGKTLPEIIHWISCDTCSRWFHAICMNISDAQMEKVDDFCYACDSCTVRGRLVPKSTSPASASPGEVDELKKIIRALSEQLSKLQAELDVVRTSSKKQIDRILSKLHDNRPDAAVDRLTADLNVNLEEIQTGAHLARTCSRSVNSCRIAVNKIPLREGENVNTIVENVLTLLQCSTEMENVTSCFRLPVKPSKWSDRSLTPTILVIFNNADARQRVLKRYFERHKEAKLCNLKDGPALDYRFTLNEVLSVNTFRIRNLAIRFKQQGLVKSVFLRNDRVSVLLPGQRRYVPVETTAQLQEMTGTEHGGEDSSSIFFDARSTDVSASSRC